MAAQIFRPRFLALSLLLLAALAACAKREPAPERLVLTPVAHGQLPGWAADDHAAALPAFRRSCARMLRQADATPLPPNPAPGVAGLGGTVGDWRPVCEAAARLQDGDRAAARAFFEREFRAFKAANNDQSRGLFTGYYEAELRGARQPSARFPVPLHRTPSDLVSVDLADFGSEFAGRSIAGRVVQGRLRPYDDRAAIAGGALKGRNLELVWVDDPIDAFFLHIQGSGRVQMDDSSVLRVGYAAKNGHVYTAIGRELVARGVMTTEQVSMQSLRAWLKANPDQAQALMNVNRSYVFFNEVKVGGPDEGPLGAQSVPLTPGRSLAVDRRYIALGLPVWLDVNAPEGGNPRWSRLMVAQDTGGAIRGPVRGDVFWGWGEEAAARAGAMRDRGEYYLLLPHGVAARVPPPPR